MTCAFSNIPKFMPSTVRDWHCRGPRCPYNYHHVWNQSFRKAVHGCTVPPLSLPEMYWTHFLGNPIMRYGFLKIMLIPGWTTPGCHYKGLPSPHDFQGVKIKTNPVFSAWMHRTPPELSKNVLNAFFWQPYRELWIFQDSDNSGMDDPWFATNRVSHPHTISKVPK